MSDKRIGSSRFTSSFCDSASVRELYLRWSNCDCENKYLKNILWILESTEVERTFSKRGTSDGTAIYMVVSIIKSWILYFKPTPSTEMEIAKGKLQTKLTQLQIHAKRTEQVLHSGSVEAITVGNVDWHIGRQSIDIAVDSRSIVGR